MQKVPQEAKFVTACVHTPPRTGADADWFEKINALELIMEIKQES